MKKTYWNSRRKLFSVVTNGIVTEHTPRIVLKNARFMVSPNGRERVRREGKKNVHAYIQGTPVNEAANGTRSVSYNPYRDDFFMCDGAPIDEAAYVYCSVEDGKPVVKV